MTASANRQVILAARPVGLPKAADFRIEAAPVPEPGAGQVLVRNLWMSVDPYMRGRMSDRKSYAPSFQVGQPMEGRAVGQVVKSNHPQVKEGAAVSSMLGWREYFVAPGESLNVLDPSLPLSSYLGVLGIPGFTGWYGLKHIGRPRSGETLVVSGAAGATGSLVMQLGKILGCRVVGTAGSDDKCALALEHGAAHAINYRTEDFVARVKEITGGQGVKVVHDSVGKDTFDRSLKCLRPFGLFVSFGNASGPVPPFALGTLGPLGSLYVTRPTLFTHLATRESTQAMADELFEVVRSGAVRIRIGQRYALADAAQAHRDLEARRTTGSSVLMP